MVQMRAHLRRDVGCKVKLPFAQFSGKLIRGVYFYEPAEPHLRTCVQKVVFAVQKLKILESTPLDGHRYAHAATHTKCGDAAFGVGIFKKM